MKKIFTLFLVFSSAFALLAQNPYVNAAKTGLANSFDTEADVVNDYMSVGWWFAHMGGEGDTAKISWVDGAMKIEQKAEGDWDYAMANFMISPDLTETIDISNKFHITFKYKNLSPNGVALVANFLTNDGSGELSFGGDVWLEGEDVTYGSDEWITVDADFTLEGDPTMVAVLQIGLDGVGGGSVIIDDVVFGDYSVSANPYVNDAMTGLANSFDAEADVVNDYMSVGWWFAHMGGEGDTAKISWVDGAMKIEQKAEGDWDYAMANFMISPDLTETIDISNKFHITFKYKNLSPNGVALVANFLTNDGSGELSFGGDVWLEGEDVTYGSDEWITVDADFTLEGDPTIVAVLQIGLDGVGGGSVMIDDVVFGDIVVSMEEIEAYKTGIQVYPNPANDFIRIKNAGREFDVTIFNAVGQQILYSRDLEQINVSTLENGLYFVRVDSKTSRETFKVLVR